MKDLMLQEVVEKRIFLIRGQKVMMDRDLAKLYGVTTKNLKRQVRRNIERFPIEFMFQLTEKEWDELVPIWHQFKTRKHSYIVPFAFTEHGVAMLASVLKSERAIKVSLIIIKTFVRLREILLVHKDLAAKVEMLELQYKNHEIKFSQYDEHIAAIFEAIKKLMAPLPEPPKRRIGFHQG